MDGLTGALGLNFYLVFAHMKDSSNPTDKQVDSFYRQICRSELAQMGFDAGQTNVTTLGPLWHIDNLLLTRSGFPSVSTSHKLTKRVPYCMYTMLLGFHPMHLGSLVMNTFYKFHLGPLITRPACHFMVDLVGLTDINDWFDSFCFDRDILHNANLLAQADGNEWVDGLSLPPKDHEEYDDDGEKNDDADNDDDDDDKEDDNVGDKANMTLGFEGASGDEGDRPNNA
ncbi:unnamed protein product [Linum trigynum]|uniref:Uncharacterized protein n=1 Tax=Linum trigynum TaxID=586398 RepID=A0AAV2FA32_9ROSI